MSLMPFGLTPFNFAFDNWGANPSETIGTSVVPGSSNLEGSWTQIATGSDIAQDCYWVYLQVHTGAVSTAQKDHVLDLGIDPAGGTSYTAFFNDLEVTASPALTAAGAREFCFPIFIKAGSSVAVRVMGSNASAGTLRVAAKFFGQPTRPELVPKGTVAQTFGTISGSHGPAITPGNAADGAWVDLGAVTDTPKWWWQLGYGLSNITITAEYTYLELAFGDATNQHQIFKVMHGGTTAETCGLSAQTQMLACAAYKPVPVGANIYVRARCGNAPDTGYHAMAIGIGG
jgi:hypothetical protein